MNRILDVNLYFQNTRLSESPLSFKLSHHQFITSVDVAEVTIKTIKKQLKQYSKASLQLRVIIYTCTGLQVLQLVSTLKCVLIVLPRKGLQNNT